jgi:hypothetical protein
VVHCMVTHAYLVRYVRRGNIVILFRLSMPAGGEVYLANYPGARCVM